MASGAIDFGIGRILSVLENEMLQQAGLSDEIEMMKQKLMFMKSFLEDMDKHHGNTSSDNSSVFTTFVKNTRDLAYQIENIIDKFTYQKNGHRSHSRLQRAIHFPVYMWKRRPIVEKLEKMNRKIQEMSDSLNTFHPDRSHGALPMVDGGNTKWAKNLGESSCFVGDDSLVGIDEARGKLTGWLLSPEPQRIVVPVVGMGGSGKTTLVGNIFRSQRVRRHFDSYSWVTISQSYDIEDVFKTMIKDFSKEQSLHVPTDLSSMRYRELVEMLVTYLQPKKYFIVLDDVWNTSFWKEISVALPDGIHGSRVMITTREDRIAHFCYGTTSRFHRIEPLKEDKAWDLFCNKAFSGRSDQCITPNIESVARNLVQKCGGLPLAIVALGSMMSTRRLESEWRKVYNSLNWELSNNPDLKDVQRILVLSFSDLPYPLKHCFLYCCIFPEDYIIKRKRLIRLWMAQGFVQQTRGVTPEEVADSYLMELVYRNMLQVVLRNHCGRPKAFKMHDMVREISLMISREEKFCDIYDDKAEETQNGETRHLCVQREINSGLAHQNIQTLLMCLTTKQKIVFPTTLKLLRALDLEDSRITILPESLANLFNLKYLNLTGTRVRQLPKSFHRLLNLETLNTKFSKIKKLPMGISKLQNLRYLVTFGHSNNDWSIVSGTKVSPDICELKRLRVMDCIHAETEIIKNLSNMTHLTRIGLVKVRKDHGDDLCNSLNKMKDLRFLSLWSIDKDEPLQLDALSLATKIEKLFVAGKLDRLPCWFNNLHNLTELCLRWSRLDEDAIPCIQALPNLVWLSFFNAYRGDRLCFLEGFQSLKILLIGDMPCLTEIVIQKGAMPDLQKLHIQDCNGITSIPIGIENLTNLLELRLRNVSDELIESIREEQSIDRLKVSHIPTIKHYFITQNGVSCENLS